jgi:hypothetical protein
MCSLTSFGSLPVRVGRRYQRRGAGRAGGLSGRDRDQLRSAVPRSGGPGAAGLVPTPARSVAVQPAAADAGHADLARAAATRPLARPRQGAARRRHPARGRASYPGCRQRSQFAGFARYGYSKSQHRFGYGVRLVLLTDTRGLQNGLHARAREREGIRAARRSAHRHPGRDRDRRQGPSGVAATATGSPPTASPSSLPSAPAPPPTSAGSALWPRYGS